eukprot:1482527-Rhodomonas_salina.6
MMMGIFNHFVTAIVQKTTVNGWNEDKTARLDIDGKFSPANPTYGVLKGSGAKVFGIQPFQLFVLGVCIHPSVAPQPFVSHTSPLPPTQPPRQGSARSRIHPLGDHTSMLHSAST